MAKRLNPALPAWYLPYSLAVAVAKPRVMIRKKNPVTSSHNW
jgi:hypothetical protein